MELVAQVETQAVTLVAEEIIINKRTLETQVVTLVEILVVELVVAVELTQVAELILNLELVKALVDLVMVKDQDKVLDKV